MLTNQEVFDKVVKHLLTQKARAVVGDPDNQSCRYRTAEGLKCAVGCLIPDDMYSIGMENNSIGSLLSAFPRVDQLLEGVDYNLLADLQCIHDGDEPEKWHRLLRGVGERYHLKTEVINAF